MYAYVLTYVHTCNHACICSYSMYISFTHPCMHDSCYTGTHDLPDMYVCRSPQALSAHYVRQITSACVTTVM